VMGLTAIETTGNTSDDNLESEESTHNGENFPVSVVDGVDSDDMDSCQDK
jgi:hypothetical protein